MTGPVPTTVGISVLRLPDSGVRLVFTNALDLDDNYLIDLDAATSLQLTLMMVNAVAVGTDVFRLGEQAR